MESPYGRDREPLYQTFAQVDDDTLRGLLALRRSQRRPWLFGAAMFGYAIGSQAFLHRSGWPTSHPLLSLGIMYVVPVVVLLLVTAWQNQRFAAACRRAGLSRDATVTLRAFLRTLPPRLPLASPDEMLRTIRSQQQALQRPNG